MQKQDSVLLRAPPFCAESQQWVSNGVRGHKELHHRVSPHSVVHSTSFLLFFSTPGRHVIVIYSWREVNYHLYPFLTSPLLMLSPHTPPPNIILTALLLFLARPYLLELLEGPIKHEIPSRWVLCLSLPLMTCVYFPSGRCQSTKTWIPPVASQTTEPVSNTGDGRNLSSSLYNSP